jgi:hypothetical protein
VACIFEDKNLTIMRIFRVLFLAAAMLFVCGLTSSLKAQKLKTDDVPGDVTQSFASEYPDAKVTGWSLEANNYVASFKDDGSDGKAYFSNTGTWLKTIYPIPVSEIPLSISTYVTSNYPNYEISVCNLREMPKVGTHYYLEVRFPEVGGKDEPSVLTFNYVGNLLERKDPEGWVLRTDEPTKPTTDHNVAPSKPAKVEVVSNDRGAKTNEEVKEEKKKEKEAQQAKEEKQDKDNAKADKSADKGKKGKKEAEAPHDPWAQYAIAEKDVPAIVMKTFKKKATKPEDTKWFKVGETYVGKCIMREFPMEVYISTKGVWKKTYSYIAQDRINSSMMKHIETYYKGYKFSFAYKELRADKKNKVYIEFYEKKNWKKKLPTGAWFDEKTRKLIRTVDPNFEDPFNDPDLFNDVKMSEEDMQAAIKELPAGVNSYIASNYPSYTIRSTEPEEDKDLGEIHRVEIASPGNSVMILYFDKNGNFLKKETHDGMKTVKSYGDYDEIQVPEVVLNAFKAKFPRVVDAVWDEDENENYDAQFLGTKGREMCIFTPNGVLLEDLYFLDVNKLTPEIERYIKDTYGKSEIQQYFSVKKDGKNYYKVIILPNKEKYPKYLWFTATGEFDRVEE